MEPDPCAAQGAATQVADKETQEHQADAATHRDGSQRRGQRDNMAPKQRQQRQISRVRQHCILESTKFQSATRFLADEVTVFNFDQ